MSNFWLLIKVNLLNTFNPRKLKIQTKEGKLSVLMLILLILGVIASYGLSFVYMFMIGTGLANGGMPSMVLSLGISVSFLLVLITGITNANGYLFRSRDFEILNSLPIKTGVIFASKLLYLTAINYLIFSLIYFPTLAVYAIFNQTDFVFWILAVFAFFLIPLFPLTLGSVIAFLLGRISPRLKYKNAVQLILSLALIIIILLLSFNAQIIETDPTLFATMIKNLLSKTGEYAYKGIHLRSAVDYLFFVTLSVVPFSVFYIILGNNYLSVNSRMGLGYVNRSYRMKVQEPTKQTYALLKKELRRYFGTSIYVMNTIVGPLLSTVMMIYVVIQKDMLTAGLQQIITEMGGNVQSVMTYFSLILTGGFIFTLSMITTTACSISIEGKQFWILKSAPVDPKQVFFAKIMVNVLVTIPFIVLNTILCAIVFPISFLDGFFLITIPSVFALFMTFMGLFVNLSLPKLDYNSDMKAVKQSASVLVNMLLGFLSAAVVIVPSVFSVTHYSVLSGFLSALGISGLLLFIIVTLVYTRGITLYNRINA